MNGAPVAGVAAALTRMSTPPSSRDDLARPSPPPMRRRRCRPARRSPVRPLARATSSAAARSASSPRATSATSAPSAASARPTASPMPRLPPVTRARRPVSSRSMVRQAVTARLACLVSKGEMTSFEAFRKRRTALLTTYKRDGTPVATPVTIAVDGDHAYVRTWDSAWKAKRMRNNPAVLVAPATVRGRPTGDAIARAQPPARRRRGQARRPRDRAPPADPPGRARPAGPPADALPDAALRAHYPGGMTSDGCDTGVCGSDVPPLVGSVLTGTRADPRPGGRGARARRASAQLTDVQRRIVEEAALGRAAGPR